MEKDFINFVGQILEKQEKQMEQINEEARIELLCSKKFRTELLDYIDLNNEKSELRFEKENILNEACMHDIRKNMDGEIINVIAKRGYTYCEDLSDASVLVFKKVDAL